MKSWTTLALTNVGIGGTCNPVFRAAINLIVQDLDERGFVTDNQSFIDAVLRKEQPSKEMTANKIVSLARQIVGRRLIGVTGEVKDMNRAVPISWGHKPNTLPATPDLGTLGFSEARIVTDLVDNAICGGFAGYFLCDLKALTMSKPLPSAADRIRVRMDERFGEKTYKASCEELANGVIAVASETIGNPALEVVSRVYNKTGYVEAVWQPGAPLPKFPREATSNEVRGTISRERSTYRAC